MTSCVPAYSTPMHCRCHFLSRQVRRGSSALNSEATHVTGQLRSAGNLTTVQQPESTATVICG